MKTLTVAIAGLLCFLIGIVDSAALTVSIFGPAKYCRDPAQPTIQKDLFGGQKGPAKLIVINGDSSAAHRVSSGLISINGIKILAPSDFNQNMHKKEVLLNLNENNEISVELKSKPGTCITVQIFQSLYDYSEPASLMMGLREAVQANSVQEILKHFDPRVLEKYESKFNENITRLGELSQALEKLQVLQEGDTTAIYTFQFPRDSILLTNQILIIKGADGYWKIIAF